MASSSSARAPAECIQRQTQHWVQEQRQTLLQRRHSKSSIKQQETDAGPGRPWQYNNIQQLAALNTLHTQTRETSSRRSSVTCNALSNSSCYVKPATQLHPPTSPTPTPSSPCYLLVPSLCNPPQKGIEVLHYANKGRVNGPVVDTNAGTRSSHATNLPR